MSDYEQESPGGMGEECLSKQDIRRYRTAIRNRWAIPDEMKVNIIYQMNKVLESKDSDDRSRVGAAKVLIECDKVDQKDAALEVEKQAVAISLYSASEMTRRALSDPISLELMCALDERLAAPPPNESSGIRPPGEPRALDMPSAPVDPESELVVDCGGNDEAAHDLHAPSARQE